MYKNEIFDKDRNFRHNRNFRRKALTLSRPLWQPSTELGPSPTNLASRPAAREDEQEGRGGPQRQRQQRQQQQQVAEAASWVDSRSAVDQPRA